MYIVMQKILEMYLLNWRGGVKPRAETEERRRKASVARESVSWRRRKAAIAGAVRN